MQQLLLECSLNQFVTYRCLEGEQDDGGDETTEWKIDVKAPRVVIQVGSNLFGDFLE
jgi:hypothetical protein